MKWRKNYFRKEVGGCNFEVILHILYLFVFIKVIILTVTITYEFLNR
jgi:hypothetical protein